MAEGEEEEGRRRRDLEKKRAASGHHMENWHTKTYDEACADPTSSCLDSSMNSCYSSDVNVSHMPKNFKVV